MRVTGPNDRPFRFDPAKSPHNNGEKVMIMQRLYVSEHLELMRRRGVPDDAVRWFAARLKEHTLRTCHTADWIWSAECRKSDGREQYIPGLLEKARESRDYAMQERKQVLDSELAQDMRDLEARWEEKRISSKYCWPVPELNDVAAWAFRK